MCTLSSGLKTSDRDLASTLTLPVHRQLYTSSPQCELVEEDVPVSGGKIALCTAATTIPVTKLSSRLDRLKSGSMPPTRTIPPAKAIKTERTHEENQERCVSCIESPRMLANSVSEHISPLHGEVTAASKPESSQPDEHPRFINDGRVDP